MRLPRPGPRFLWRFLKRLTPTSLFGRSLLIIVLPVALMQIAVTYVFFDAHWQTVNSHLTEGLAGQWVQPYWLWLNVKEAGGQLVVVAEEGRVAIEARFRQ